MSSISLREWIDGNGVKYIPIKDSERYEYHVPKMHKKEDLWIWEERRKNCNGTVDTNPQYVGITKNLSCYGDGSVVGSYGYIADFGVPSSIIPSSITKTVHRPCVNLMEKWGGTNYWHWISTSLVKLYLAQKIDGFRFQDYSYLVDSLQNGFVRDSLVGFGIKPEQCIEAGSAVSCENLILTSRINDHDKEPIRYIREFFRKPNSKSNKKIYISRSGNRRILNEDQIMEVLESRGFEKIKCELLSFPEQVSLFSNASVVIGPHGAGITNILFAHDNVKVLEIRNKTYHGSCYYLLCNKLGFDYYNLYGEGHEISDIREASLGLHDNIIVNKTDLINTLDMMGV